MQQDMIVGVEDCLQLFSVSSPSDCKLIPQQVGQEAWKYEGFLP